MLDVPSFATRAASAPPCSRRPPTPRQSPCSSCPGLPSERFAHARAGAPTCYASLPKIQASCALPSKERFLPPLASLVLTTATPSSVTGSKPINIISFETLHYDADTDKTFNFLTNHLAVAAPTVAQLYRYRCRSSYFFKWIKQHLHIKSFFGTSENAVKTQIWDCGDSVRAGCGAQEAVGSLGRALHNVAGFEFDLVRENALFSSCFPTLITIYRIRKTITN